ncbi:26S proteasome non-ATPase regulatory subunit 13 [Biomphalaria pfeifferi]|uniref:26S proteasome non-ATPase regulatory subunit 13 n=1 Tax=Biomphalaria pfeifferi TaxID=112525 RepID=A0AAD8C2F4_BIOPF|nr:26S proteasome non-ATPase regulatory subunit 13 [Biomphalaria pfeifferi]
MPNVAGYLAEQQRKSSGDVATEWGLLEELYNKKLWHQLTLRLLQFVKNPIFTKGDGIFRLYENFLSDFEHRINPLSLAEICVYVVRQIHDPKQAIEFLEKLKEKVKVSEEAKVLCMTTMGIIYLKNKDFPPVKALIEECEKILNDIDGVTTVHGRFYELTSNYHKLMGNHAQYYQEALRFLGCTELNDMPRAEQAERAFNIGLAAIIGEGVYNFGELLAHDILASLKGSDKEWLVDLLYAFNSGDIDKFTALREKWSTQPDLKANEVVMRNKINLLCLMEMTFQRPATDRQLTFDNIAQTAKIDKNLVELLVMKALSLGLVRGSIDEIEQKCHMTWVQPRVLDRKQIASMQVRLEQLGKDIGIMERLLEDTAHDILT